MRIYKVALIRALANEEIIQTSVRTSSLGGQNLSLVSCIDQGNKRDLLFRTKTNKSTPKEPLRNPK